MNYFWDLLEGLPGIRAHRPPKGSGIDDGRLVRALRPLSAGGAGRAVGAPLLPGRRGRGRALRAGLQQGAAPASALQHRRRLQPGQARPASPTCRRAWTSASRWAACRSPRASRSASFGIPWFKHYRPEIIEEYAAAYPQGGGALPRSARRRHRQSRGVRGLGAHPAARRVKRRKTRVARILAKRGNPLEPSGFLWRKRRDSNPRSSA